jgi:hypothetical protein
MHRPDGREPHSIQDSATRAVAAHGALIPASRETLSDLAAVDRVELARFLAELDRRGCFDSDVLGTTNAVIACQQGAIVRVGGAPIRRWTVQGDGYLVGGTKAGRRIGCIRDALRRFQREAHAAADRLAAEAQLARQRGAAAGDGFAGDGT